MNKYLPQILIGISLLFSFAAGFISYKRDDADNKANFGLAQENKLLGVGNKKLLEENKNLGESNIRLSVENKELSVKIYSLAEQISNLSKSNLELSKKLNTKVEEEAIKNTMSEELKFFDNEPIPASIEIKFGNSITYQCPKERFEYGFSIMDFLINGPTKTGTFNINLKGNKLYVDAKIVDFDDKVVGEIIHNKWEANRNVAFKRNFNSKALELIDNFGVPVLQFKIISNSQIYIGGVFHYENSAAIFCQEKTFRLVQYGANKNQVSSESKRVFFDQYMFEARKIKSIF